MCSLQRARSGVNRAESRRSRARVSHTAPTAEGRRPRVPKSPATVAVSAYNNLTMTTSDHVCLM